MIALRREWNPGLSVRLLELPHFVSSTAGTYWHVPRSAFDFGDRVSVTAWCGVTVGTRPLTFRDDRPAENVCGTCLGRFDGERRAGGLIFAPRDVFAPPRSCPGDEVVNGLCTICGDRARYWGDGVQRHAPGSLFIARCTPCPDHGWRDAVARDSRLVCRSWVGSGFDYCDFDCGPGL